MSAFSRGAGVTVINAAIQHNATSDPGADRGIKDVAKSAGGTPARFRQSSSIGIVIHSNWHAISRGDLVGQREISPAGKIRRIQNDTGFRIERSGSADSYAVNARCRRGGYRIDGP